MTAVKMKQGILMLLVAGAGLLLETSCSWKSAAEQAAEQEALDTRPEPKLKKSPYTVRGKRYYPMGMKEALQYAETGEASLYNNNNTIGAMGERLRGLYATHRTLPLPCQVRVTNLENGKSCIARVNDRGPFHPRRIIDISPAVAKAIGFHRWGVLQVKVETVAVGDGPNQRKKD